MVVEMSFNGGKRPRKDDQQENSDDETNDEENNEINNDVNKKQDVLILNLEKKYVDNVKLLNQDFRNEFNNIKLKQLKITPANNIIIILEDKNSLEMILNSQNLFTNNKKVELDNSR